MVRDIAKLLSGLVVLVLLLLLVIRPLMRSLASVAKAVVTPVIAPMPQAAAGMDAGHAGRPGTVIAYEQQIAQARSLVAKDPARVAQVVRDWVEKDE